MQATTFFHRLFRLISIPYWVRSVIVHKVCFAGEVFLQQFFFGKFSTACNNMMEWTDFWSEVESVIRKRIPEISFNNYELPKMSARICCRCLRPDHSIPGDSLLIPAFHSHHGFWAPGIREILNCQVLDRNNRQAGTLGVIGLKNDVYWAFFPHPSEKGRWHNFFVGAPKASFHFGCSFVRDFSCFADNPKQYLQYRYLKTALNTSKSPITKAR